MKNENKTQLGKIFLKRKLVNSADLDDLLQEQRDDHKPLASKALEKGLVKEIPVLKALSEQHGVPAVNLDEVVIDLENLKLIPQDIAEKHLILPVEITGDTVHLAMANPSDRRVIDEIEFVSGKRIFPHVSLHNQISAAIKNCYKAQIDGDTQYRGSQVSADQEMGSLESKVDSSKGWKRTSAVITEVDNSENMDFVVDIDIPIDEVQAVDPVDTQPEPDQHAPVPPAVPAPAAAEIPAPHPARVEPPPGVAKKEDTGLGEATSPPLKVLVVDDEEDIRLLISRVLLDKGYKVVSASRGLEAIQKVQSENPDMIILDAMLPEVHGFDICKKIKGSKKYGHIPVIMISAIYRGWRYAQDLKDSYGVDDFIEKPFKVAELIKKVQFFSKPKDPASEGMGEDLSKQAERILQAGIGAYKAGKIDDAVDLLRKGINIDPLAFKLHYHLALLLGKKGLNYQAIRALENALELAPNYYPALKNLAVLYQKAGFKFKAIETWERTLGYCEDEETREGIKRHLVNLLG